MTGNSAHRVAVPAFDTYCGQGYHRPFDAGARIGRRARRGAFVITEQTEHSQRDWVIASPHPQRDAVAAAARIAPLLAQVLLNRGVESASDVGRFLTPDFRALHSPDELPGANEAAARLINASRAGKRIVIYGDYDVDGVTGTAILWHALRLAGADVTFYIPSRFDEGYGLNCDAIDQIKEQGADLIVTTDCGVTAVEPVARANELGMEVIITDHHQPKDELPAASVIVHPTACGASPNPDLCGAAVAMKVAWAMARDLCGGGRVNDAWRQFLVEATAFAALGLVADVVPLTGENRIITSHGLRHLKHAQNAGLRALIEVSSLEKKDSFDDYDVGFKLAPRLNAVGRMGHARLAVEMFTRAGEEQARQIASTLDSQNRQRQTIEREIAQRAAEMVVEHGFDRESRRAIVLASSQWHAGVIGIVASRLVEQFHRPTVLISLENGVGQGSGRSVKHFPLHEALKGCEEHLISFGGHAMAAGLKIEADRVDDFTEAFLEQAANRLTAKDLRPKLYLDDEVGLTELAPGAVDALNRLAPFGPGNQRVRLATREVRLAGEPRVVGRGGAHLQFTVREGDELRKVIAFGRGKDAELLGQHQRLRVAFEPLMNEWNGQRRVELRLIDWRLLS